MLSLRPQRPGFPGFGPSSSSNRSTFFGPSSSTGSEKLPKIPGQHARMVQADGMASNVPFSTLVSTWPHGLGLGQTRHCRIHHDCQCNPNQFGPFKRYLTHGPNDVRSKYVCFRGLWEHQSVTIMINRIDMNVLIPIISNKGASFFPCQTFGGKQRLNGCLITLVSDEVRRELERFAVFTRSSEGRVQIAKISQTGQSLDGFRTDYRIAAAHPIGQRVATLLSQICFVESGTNILSYPGGKTEMIVVPDRKRTELLRLQCEADARTARREFCEETSICFSTTVFKEGLANANASQLIRREKDGMAYHYIILSPSQRYRVVQHCGTVYVSSEQSIHDIEQSLLLDKYGIVDPGTWSF